MADPRGKSGFEGIGQQTATFWADDFGTGSATITFDATKTGGSTQVGLAVALVSPSAAEGKSEIDLTVDGDAVLGKLLRVESDGACTVQFAGCMKLPGGASATLTPGTRIVGALGASSAQGYIRSIAATTGSYVQATATEAQKARGQILNSAVTTAVDVYL